MAPQVAYFNPRELRDAKQHSRIEDDSRLESGQSSVQDLQRRNGFFSCFDPSQMSIAKRRVRIRVA